MERGAGEEGRGSEPGEWRAMGGSSNMDLSFLQSTLMVVSVVNGWSSDQQNKKLVVSRK